MQAEDLEQTPDLIPARMLNEVVYCPRLFYLEYVMEEWDDNADTVHGRRVHRRVDARTQALPTAEELTGEKLHARSVTVAAPLAGLIAKTDLIEAEEGRVVPVDYKRGAAPDPARVPLGAWPADRVQIGAQILALRETGYTCTQGVLYYAASKTRVPVEMDDALLAEVHAAVAEARRLSKSKVPPLPLVASPKCPRCSLVGICLPDEITRLKQAELAPPATPTAVDAEVDPPALRRLLPASDDRLPLYVQKQGARIGRTGECLEVRTKEGETSNVRLRETSHVCVFGSVQITAAALNDLCDRGIGVSLFSYGGWHYGEVSGFSGKNVFVRLAQFAAAADPAVRLRLARAFVIGKIRNCRTIIRRNAADAPKEDLFRLMQLAGQAERVESEESLLGIEGTAARIYFEHFGRLLSPRSGGSSAFDWRGRNRRPPRDPVNALLSLAYALLLKDVRVALCAAGFDPMVGFYHKPRHGKPALALDLMEEFRPLVADSLVLLAVNTEVIQDSHFLRAAGAVSLTDPGRRAFLEAYERLMNAEVTHPIFGYQISYRQVLEVQARLLSRVLTGELDAYPSFRTR